MKAGPFNLVVEHVGVSNCIMKAVLILENGAYFVGKQFGAAVNTSGEVGKS